MDLFNEFFFIFELISDRFKLFSIVNIFSVDLIIAIKAGKVIFCMQKLKNLSR